MKDWFKIEAIDSGTYAISEYGHIEETHSYLVLGAERAALIDTGLGVSDILAAVRQLTELPVCVLTTHAHWDHIGGHGLFEHIAAHELEAGWLSGSFPLPPDTVRSLLTAGLRRRPEGFDAAKYGVYCGGATQLQRDGDVFELGGRRLRVLHTPGHSPGSCCYFEEERGYLFTGDLAYRGRLDAFYPGTDPIAFKASLERAGETGARRILPGHHELDVPADILARAARAFGELENRGSLGSGREFYFGDFSIKA